MIVSRDLKILPSECPRWSARRFAKDDMPRNEPTKQKPRTNSYHFYHALNLGFVTEKWFQGANIIRTGRYSYSFHYYSNLPLLLPAPLSCLFSLKFEKTPKKLPDSFLLISIFFPPYLVHSSWQTFPTSRRWIIVFPFFRNTSFSSRRRRSVTVVHSSFLWFPSHSYSTPSNWIPKATTSSHELLIELLPPHFTIQHARFPLVNNSSRRTVHRRSINGK